MKKDFKYKKGDKVYVALDSGKVMKTVILSASPSCNSAKLEGFNRLIHVGDFGRTAQEALTKKFIRKSWSVNWQVDSISKRMSSLKQTLKEMKKIETKLHRELDK